MKCRFCKGDIAPGHYWQLAILDDPCFCSRDCMKKFIESNQPKVGRYVGEFMSTEIREDT